MSGSASSSNAPDSSVQAPGVAGGAVGGAAAGSAAGPYGAAIGAAVGAGISIWGQLSAASAEAEIDAKKQAIAKQQADEIAAREQINDAIREKATFQSQLQFGAEFAASGHEGAGIGSQLEIKRQGDLAIALADRDATYQENMLLEGGALQGKLGEVTQEAGYFNAAGTAISAGAQFLKPNMGTTSPSTSQALPRFEGG